MSSLERSFLHFTEDWRNPVGLATVAAVLFVAVLYWEQTRFMLKSLRRNLLRSVLTGLATFILVLVITLVWSILAFLDTADRGQEQEPQGDRHREISDPQPDALSPTPAAWPRGAAQARATTGQPRQGRHDVGVLRRHARPEQEDAREHRLLLRMEPRKLISLDGHGGFTSMMDDIDLVSDARPAPAGGRLRGDGEVSLQGGDRAIAAGGASTRRSASASRSPASTTRTSIWSSRSWTSCPAAVTSRARS